ncbi:MAG TPA: alpha-amylase family glycosyl hydrolase [Saprospiraceae bacterium]|nr:alpha-amylase family glycosyl hydrolase [Saprospiraceae bacterium]
MKKIFRLPALRPLLFALCYLLFASCFFPLALRAQVSCDPIFPTASQQITVHFNATEGNGGLAGFTGPVYAHMGVFIEGKNGWQNVPTTWGVADPVGLMTNEGPNLWKKTFTINSFFSVQPGEKVTSLAFVFRNQDGSLAGRAADNSDIFYPVYPENSGLLTTFLSPTVSIFLASPGSQISVKTAASQTADLKLFDNGVQVAAEPAGTKIETNITAGAAGVHKVDFVATTATESATSTFVYVVAGNIVTENPPAGTELGINYIDNQTVRFNLYAPNKLVVHLMGDFNNWLPDGNYQMKRGTDNATWWLEVTGLTPGQQYRFQYLVDGSLRIADPLSTLVLDAGNDPYIPTSTYPNLPPYPAGKTSGAVSVLQTAQQPFDWQASNYERPKKTDLVIYELLMRDFIEAHDYQTLLDTLDYIERLGVTAIELMPVNEFDGNNSWGYNPAFHKALDKYYGTAEALKMLVDACHQRNIAVILDVVFNQASNASPLAQLYWDGANNRPAADNPWLNPVATHPFSVFNDFNHESAATRNYVKNCVKYWLTEFKVDGFRFDLSKGFTQKNTGTNVGAWGQYDGGRIATLKGYADFIWSVDPTSYVILEHFADNLEEKELSNYGMMLWGNMHGSYKETALGFNLSAAQTDLSWVSWQQRGWSKPHLIGYFESHDEDRIGYECATYGNNNGDYNTKWLPYYAMRIELLNNLFYTVPGPKMLWEFGELAYDFSINYCEDGTVNNNCRLSPKPIRWDFRNDPYRRRLRDVTASLLYLRKNYDVFETTDFQIDIDPGLGRTVRLNAPGMNVHVVANVALTSSTVTPDFQHTGTWYEYYTGQTLDVTNVNAPIMLGPGEYRLYTDQFVALPPGVNPTPVREIAGILSGMEVYPNPVGNAFSVDFSLDKSAAIQIEVTDLTGKTVSRLVSDELPSGIQHFEIDTDGWQSGVYITTVRDERGAQLKKKLIKL